MRLVTFRTDSGPTRAGAIVDDGVIGLSALSVQEVLAGGREALAAAAGEVSRSREPAVPLADVRLEAPLRPALVVAPGPRPDPQLEDRLARHREFYLKSAHTVVGTAEPIPYRAALGTLSYRAQLGLVLGPTPRHAPADAALRALLGAVVSAELYSVDLLRVGWEGTMWHVRYGEGASFDGACPVAPFFVTADEFELEGLPLEDATESAKVRRQDVAEFVSYVSHWMELGPMALVLCGSSHGPLLSLDGGDPVVRFPEGEARVDAGGRITVRSEPLGELDVAVGTDDTQRG